MIDIHSHIIFDVDDGPKNREMTRALLQASYEQGVRTIIATSHRRKGMFETPEEKIAENFKEVETIAAAVAPDLKILYGAEIYYTSDVLEKLEHKKIPSLASTSYVLIEFSMNTPYKEIHAALGHILRLGLTPVVAHIERYHCLEGDEKRVRELINMGCYMQVNSVNVLQPKLFKDSHKVMKKRVKFFLEKDLVHFVASDMHNKDKRPSYMKQAYQIVQKKYGKTRADSLFKANQELLINDEII